MSSVDISSKNFHDFSRQNLEAKFCLARGVRVNIQESTVEVSHQVVQFYKSVNYAVVFGDDQAVSNVSSLATSSFLTKGRKTRRGPLDGHVGKPTGRPTARAPKLSMTHPSQEGGGVLCEYSLHKAMHFPSEKFGKQFFPDPGDRRQYPRKC